MTESSPHESITYEDMCSREGVRLQYGMNYRVSKTHSVLLMNSSRGSPYRDIFDVKRRILVYEGHDIRNEKGSPPPKHVAQPLLTRGGKPTQNAYFYMAAWEYKKGYRPAERVRVYEKIERGLWRDLGFFLLVDAFVEHDGRRRVFKFKLVPEQADRGGLLRDVLCITDAGSVPTLCDTRNHVRARRYSLLDRRLCEQLGKWFLPTRESGLRRGMPRRIRVLRGQLLYDTKFPRRLPRDVMIGSCGIVSRRGTALIEHGNR